MVRADNEKIDICGLMDQKGRSASINSSARLNVSKDERSMQNQKREDEIEVEVEI